MKTLILWLLLSVSLFVFACSQDTEVGKSKGYENSESEKPANLAELTEKYKGQTFDDCEEFFQAIYETMAVYTSKVNYAYRGNFDYIVKIEELENFMAGFEEIHIEMADKCPEKYTEFRQEMDIKISEIQNKLKEIYLIIDFENEWEATLKSLENAIQINLKAVEEQIYRSKQEIEEQKISGSESSVENDTSVNNENITP